MSDSGYDKADFTECDTCRSKSGTPLLCRGCLANRATITWLKNLLDNFKETIPVTPPKTLRLLTPGELPGNIMVRDPAADLPFSYYNVIAETIDRCHHTGCTWLPCDDPWTTRSAWLARTDWRSFETDKPLPEVE